MPPPKLKMHRATGSGKLKSIPRPQPIPSTSQGDQEQREAQEKFELELAWCIQRLEETLNSGKLNQKQYNDALKTLTILRSSSQPVVKKRQLMSQTFGNYRTKMADDERTYSINPNSFKFLSSTSAKSKRAYFVKKAAIVDGDKNFKFNFSIDSKMEDLSIEDNKEKKENEPGPSKIELPLTSGGEFKFNFAINTDDSL